MTVPVTEPRPPTTLAGFRVSEETVGRGIGATVKLMVVLVWRLPDVPAMMTVNVPVAAVLLALSVSVLAVAAGSGLNEAATPLGRPDADKLTLPLNPFSGVMAIVLVPTVPCMMLRLPGDAERVKLGAAVTVSVAVWVALPLDTEITIWVEVATAAVVMVKVADVDPAGTVTPAGTEAAFVLLLDKVNMAPLLGAGPLNVTVPVEFCAPPTTVVGFSVREESVGAGAVAGACSKSKIAGLGWLSGMPTNFDGEII